MYYIFLSDFFLTLGPGLLLKDPFAPFPFAIDGRLPFWRAGLSQAICSSSQILCFTSHCFPVIGPELGLRGEREIAAYILQRHIAF